MGAQQTNHVKTFETYRPLLFSIAYRMLGSVMEAEDIVQETYLRYSNTRLDTIESPKAYLSTITTRLCLDYLKSAKVRREEYIGPWLPEPLRTDDAAVTPTDKYDMISMAALVLLEKLSPLERAVLLLREVFEYSYREIALIVEKSEANCRQSYHRAKQYLNNQPISKSWLKALCKLFKPVTWTPSIHFWPMRSRYGQMGVERPLRLDIRWWVKNALPNYCWFRIASAPPVQRWSWLK